MSDETANEPAVILFAHGSRAADANDWHRRMCAALAGRTGRTVVPAFLELAEPDLPTAVDELVEAGHRRVVVLPYLLAPGRHARRDLPRLVAASSERHPGVDIELREIFGADPAVLDLLAAQLGD